MPEAVCVGTESEPMGAVVCGIDPGLAITGYAVLTRGASRSMPFKILDAGACRLDSNRSLAERLVALEADVSGVLDDYSPDVVAVEDLYAHYKHPRTAVLMGHARGVILLAAGRRGIPVQGIAATRIKRHLTGHGRADKVQIQRAIQVTLGLESPPDPPDVADALAIAFCGLAELSAQSVIGLTR